MSTTPGANDPPGVGSPVQTYLTELHGRLASLRDGVVASYIPELAKADPEWFAISAH